MAIDINLYTGRSETRLPAYWEEGEQESRAYLYLDLEGDGEMWIGSKSPSNTCWGMREHWGIQRTYPVPNNLTEVGYNDLMQHPTVVGLSKVIHEDSEVVWHGNNYRLEMGARAEEADRALEAFCLSIEPEDFQSLTPVCAAHYLVDGTYEALMSNGDTEEAVTERIVEEAIKDGYFLSQRDVEKHLASMKKQEEA